MSVGASLFQHLTGNNPFSSFVAGEQVRQNADNALSQQLAHGFQGLLNFMRLGQQSQIHQDDLSLKYATLNETSKYHDELLKLRSQQNTGGIVPSLGASGPIDGGSAPAPSEPVTGQGTPASIPSAEQMQGMATTAQQMRDNFAGLSGNQSPLEVISDPEADPSVREKALGVLQYESDMHRIAKGQPTTAQERAMKLDPQAAGFLGQPGGVNSQVDSSITPEIAAHPELLKNPAYPQMAAEAPPMQPNAERIFGDVPQTTKDAGPLTLPKESRDIQPVLVPPLDGTEKKPKSGDPFAWANIPEGTMGYKQVAPDGRSAIVRRKSGGVMLEQKIDLVQGPKGLREEKHPERIIMPDALSRAPMAVQLPNDKFGAYKAAQLWLSKIYPKMDAKTAAANHDQAFALGKFMEQLGNDPDVQTRLRRVNEADMVAPPGMAVAGSHYDPKTERQVFTFRMLKPGEAEQSKELRAQTSAAWNSYTKLRTAADKAPLEQQPDLEAKAAAALQYVMKLDPVFAGVVNQQGGGNLPSNTASNVDKLFKAMGAK